MIGALVHAGFHKTGTTSVQRLLQSNAAVLEPKVALGLNYMLRDVIQAARGYSRWRDPVSLAQFEFRLDGFVRTLPTDRTWCFSVEEFAGLLPGLPSRPDQPEILDFGAAPALAVTIRDVIARHLPKGAEIAFYYSTRAPEDWLTSVYWQHVKTQAMCDELADFTERFRPVADLDAVVGAVRHALDGTRVEVAALEQTARMANGPATPILDLLGLPGPMRARIRPVPMANPAPPQQVLDGMLALNRQGLDRETLRDAKARLVQDHATAAPDSP